MHAIVLLLSTALYAVYWQFFRFRPESHSKSNQSFGVEGSIKRFLVAKTFGLLLLGVVPVCILVLGLGYPVGELGLTLADPLISLGVPLGLLVIIIPIIATQAASEDHQKFHPEIRVSDYDRKTTLILGLGWVIYLIGYECLFRGVLLFPLVDWLGYWPGLTTMTVLYVIAHGNKSRGELLGCIPMGFIFGALALQTGSIVGPIVLHIGIALAGELLAIRSMKGADSKADA